MTYVNTNTTSEGVSTGYSTTAGNAVYSITNGTPSGPKRSGLMAAAAGNSGRVTSGSGYYGVMDLAGNLTETMVTLQTGAGWAFTGTHGDGVLAGNGEADAPSWPTTNVGAGTRGGAYFESASNALRTSDRGAANGPNSARTSAYGIRGVRTVQ